MARKSLALWGGVGAGIIVIVLAVSALAGSVQEIQVSNPYDGAMFPPEIAPPTFRWDDRVSGAGSWRIKIAFAGGQEPVEVRSNIMEWRPERELWESIKQQSREQTATVTITGHSSSTVKSLISLGRPVSLKSFTFSTSNDSVGAPIMYRDVPLPFDFAREKMELIQWRLGDISRSERPPVILENLPVCGNCHSFTPDGGLLGMDVDSGGDKGSYAVVDVEEQMFLEREKLITWSDYRREDGESTFGLLAEISPDGRYVASAVKDRVIFITREKLMFSQLFFPVKGIVAIYDRENDTIAPLPGADDPDLVQANPVWSPDGEYIIYARNPVSEYVKNDYTKNAVLTREQSAVVLGGEAYLEDSNGGEVFTFDLYRIPFNDGEGGTPEPIQGASNNGKSNYFARYSPDGKWIVFCQARSFMLLQPDSKLYIMPADLSAPPRLMNCNTDMMNSRHTWSPNSRWLAFASKANGAYTDIYLTHIDENGNDTPPVLIESFSATDRARNIPVFAPIAQDGIEQIHEAFVDYYSYVRKGDKMLSYGKIDEAERAYRTSIEMNPDYPLSYRNLATMLFGQKRIDESLELFQASYRLDSADPVTCANIGTILLQRGDVAAARAKFNEALTHDDRYGPAYQGLGIAAFNEQRTTEAERLLKQALEYHPELPLAHYYLGLIAYERRDAQTAEEEFTAVLRYQDDADAYLRLSEIHIQTDQLDKAERELQMVLRLDPNNVGAMHNLGVVYLSRQQYQQAEQIFRAVYSMTPDNPNACFMLATVLGMRVETVNDAIALYQRGLSLQPENIQAHIDLANLFMKIGRRDLARAKYEDALKLDPESPSLKRILESLNQES